MLRHAVLVFAVLISGCDMVSNALAPAHKRINAAMPVPAETEVAIQRMLAGAAQNKADKERLEEQLNRMQEARALTCSVAIKVGRFDSDQEIRDKLRNPQCFDEQNALILDWVGLHRTAQLVEEPALVPLTTIIDKLVVPGLESDTHFVALTMAKEANILVTMAYDKKYSAFSFPDFRPLSEIKPKGAQHRSPWLSSNGRVLAIPLEKGLEVYAVATGELVWSSKQYTRVMAWLPEAKVFIAQRGSDGAMAVLDPQQAMTAMYPVGGKGMVRTAVTPQGDLIVAVNYEVAQMKQVRNQTTGTLEYKLVQRWRTKAAATGDLLLLRDGKYLAFEASREIGWLDLASNKQGVWEVTNIKTHGMTKVSENELMINATPDGKSFGPYVLNIDSEEIRRVQDFESTGGQLQSLGDRAGYAFTQNRSVTIGGIPATDEPRKLLDFAAEANLKVQLARVEKMAEESARAALIQNAVKDVSPLKAPVPSNAEIAAVGVYESAHGRNGVVKIKLSPGRQPLVLVLANYESVQWQIERSGRPIHAILLSGYNPSSVVGQGNAEVVRIGRKYAYEFGSSGFSEFKGAVESVTQKPLKYFQGLYKGDEFNVR